MPIATYTRQTYPLAAARLLAQREMARRGLTWQRSAEDEALWQACLDNLQLFAESFFPHLCGTAFSSMHKEMFARDRAQAGQRDLREATAAPRGSAKTTIRGFIKVIHDCVYGLERFIAIFSHTASLADDRVKQIRDELETNQRLITVYGPQVGTMWNNSEFITSSGVRVRAASPGSQLRGILQKGSRVTKILLDDFENPEHVLSELQRQKTAQRFFSDIMKLGQPGTNVEAIGTILHPDSLLAGLLTNPGFHSVKYQAVLQFADVSAIPLWQQWRSIFLALDNVARVHDARAFFETHTAAMLKGTHVLWPERESYYDLMVMRLVEGDRAFFLEKQNDPRGSAEYLFDVDAVALCTTVPSGIVRAGGKLVPWSEIVEIAAALDPTPDKNDSPGSDYAACPVVAQDKDGFLYVVDTYLARESSTQKQITGIVDLLWKWDIKLLGIETNGFASLLVSDIREAIAQRAQQEKTSEFQVQLVSITNMRNKVQRILTLEPLWNNGWLQLSKNLDPEYFRQFQNFLAVADAGHDDAPDATEMAIRTVKHMYEKRDIS